ncbi:MAG: histidine triad nucleotide-binding protein [Clostridia bacterium]|nr:histidine triad nucleotide-binding protein [Clostridia bacterium]
MDCLFCKIINGEIPSKKVYEDDSVYAFYDIAPMAPVHVLIVPKTHIASVNEVTAENSAVISHIYEVAAKLAKELGIADEGYRVVTNCGANAGQTVFHLHFHLLGGTKLKVEMC